MTNPEEWLARYDETLKQAAAAAARTDKALRQVGGTATSPDGQVTVRVNASGATVDLVLRPGARDVEPEQLARLILRTTRQAQDQVGDQVVETIRQFVGEGGALELVKAHQQGRSQETDEHGRPLERDGRPDDDYFDNPPELIK